MFRDHGQAKKYFHDVVGWNCRMDGIQGAVLSIKLRYLDERNQLRRERAAQYDKSLRGLEHLVTPVRSDNVEHIYHIYEVRVPNRDAVLEAMAAAGVSCGIHYPVPVHLQNAYQDLGLGRGSFPVAERCAGEFLSLPMYHELTPAQVDEVVATLRQVLQA